MTIEFDALDYAVHGFCSEALLWIGIRHGHQITLSTYSFENDTVDFIYS